MEEQRAKLFQNKRPHDKSGAERSYPIRGKPRGTERVARVLFSGENGTHTDTHTGTNLQYINHTHTKGNIFTLLPAVLKLYLRYSCRQLER